MLREVGRAERSACRSHADRIAANEVRILFGFRDQAVHARFGSLGEAGVNRGLRLRVIGPHNPKPVAFPTSGPKLKVENAARPTREARLAASSMQLSLLCMALLFERELLKFPRILILLVRDNIQMI